MKTYLNYLAHLVAEDWKKKLGRQLTSALDVWFNHFYNGIYVSGHDLPTTIIPSWIIYFSY